jgi:hypothetical protein
MSNLHYQAECKGHEFPITLLPYAFKATESLRLTVVVKYDEVESVPAPFTQHIKDISKTFKCRSSNFSKDIFPSNHAATIICFLFTEVRSAPNNSAFCVFGFGPPGGQTKNQTGPKHVLCITLGTYVHTFGSIAPVATKCALLTDDGRWTPRDYIGSPQVKMHARDTGVLREIGYKQWTPLILGCVCVGGGGHIYLCVGSFACPQAVIDAHVAYKESRFYVWFKWWDNWRKMICPRSQVRSMSGIKPTSLTS